MPAKFTLKVINKYLPAEFNFYAQAPTPQTLNKDVWFSATVPLGGTEEFGTDGVVVAWCGSIQEDGNVAEGLTAPITLGTGSAPGTTLIAAPQTPTVLQFLNNPPSATKPGTFSIVTKGGFGVEDNYSVGYAWADPYDKTSFVPVFTYAAMSAMSYVFTPQPIFFITAIPVTMVPDPLNPLDASQPSSTSTTLPSNTPQSTVPAQATNIPAPVAPTKTTAPTPLPIASFDFTLKTAMNYAEITLNPDGTFSTPVYKRIHHSEPLVRPGEM